MYQQLEITGSTTATLLNPPGSACLILNNDQNNTIWIGDTNTIKASDPNGVIPLPANSSVVVDGSTATYGICASGQSALALVVPGGINFFLPVVSLTLPFGKTTGRRIVLNGANGTIEVFNAANQLVGSISPIAQNDSSGNFLSPVFTAYNTVTPEQIASLQGGVVQVGFGGGNFDMEPSNADIGALHMAGNGGGTLFEFFNAATQQIYSTGKYAARNPTTGNPETWQSLGSPAATGYNTLFGRYRLTPEGETEIDIQLQATPGAGTAGVYTFANLLPAAYQFAGTIARSYPLGYNGTLTAGVNAGSVLIDAASSANPGRVRIQIPGLPLNTIIGSTFTVPLS